MSRGVMWFHFTFKKITLVALLRMDRGGQGQWARVEAVRQVVIQENAVLAWATAVAVETLGNETAGFCLPSCAALVPARCGCLSDVSFVKRDFLFIHPGPSWDPGLCI